MKERFAARPGTHDIVDSLLDDVRFRPVVSDLVAPDEVLAAALIHRVIAVRRGMVIRFRVVKGLLDGFTRRRGERSAHSRSAVALGDFLVASRALGRIDVAGGGVRRRRS